MRLCRLGDSLVIGIVQIASTLASSSVALALGMPLPSLRQWAGALKLADRLGLRRMGTVALLGQTKHHGLIPKLKPALDALVANHIFIRQELIDAALKEAGE